MIAKKAITGDESINIKAQTNTGIWLGSAAICSGGVWQPVVNSLQDLGVAFNPAVGLTGGAAVLAFYGGLRMGRLVYGKVLKMEGVEEANYANLKADAGLSVAVGGAAGCFLGTDLSYGAANWMGGAIGIQESASAVTASMLAGTSTGLGFTAVQMGQNVIYPKDKCWVD
jgi:hypothetical protein